MKSMFITKLFQLFQKLSKILRENYVKIGRYVKMGRGGGARQEV
jgi:hypothetical protein